MRIGQLSINILTDFTRNEVRMTFEKRILWFALPPQEARAFAKLILENVENLERAGRGSPILIGGKGNGNT